MKIATYGSLKRGEYNHGRMGPQNFLGVETVRGYSIFTHPQVPYPCAIKDTDSGIEVEVFDVSQRAFDMLDNMELGAGYRPVTIETKFGSAIMWYKDSAGAGWAKSNKPSWSGR